MLCLNRLCNANLLLLIGCLLFAACGEDDSPEILPPAPNLTFDGGDQTSAQRGDTVTITLNIRAESGIASLTADGTAVNITVGETTATPTYEYIVAPDAALEDVTIDFVLRDQDDREITETYTISVQGATVEVSDDIEEDFTMVAGNRYILTTDIDVQAGATLTIEPGVIVAARYADDGLESDDPAKTRYRLAVDAGATIMANGTADNPIVMTSERAADGNAQPGDWIGLRIDGQDGSSSGSLTYVRIEYGGAIIEGGDTEPAFRIQTVDATTTIDYVQVFRSLDIGAELRGGSVNLKHLMLTECNNAAVEFDDQDGVPYTGNIQYLIIQSSEQLEKDLRDMEIRDDASVRIANMTMIGSGDDVADGDLAAIRVRDDAGGMLLFNSIISEYSDDGLRMDDPSGITDINGEFVLAHSYLFQIGDDATRDDSDPESLPLPFETDATAYFVTIAEETPADATGIDVGDYTPDAEISSQYNSTDLGDFFEEASFVGAVGSEDWTTGWSVNAEGNVN